MIRLICLDADDTLWHNEAYFVRTQRALAELLGGFAPAQDVQARLEAVEHRNGEAYGYGAKGYVLSMIETALELGGDGLPAATVGRIRTLGREIVAHPVERLEAAPD